MSVILVFVGTFIFVLGSVVFSGSRKIVRFGLTTRRRGLIALVIGLAILTVGISMQS